LADQGEILEEFQKDISEKINFNEEKISNFLVKTDKLIGIRAIGIIFYGALPSYLALVGLLNIKIEEVDSFSSSISSILLVSTIPLALTFILVRNQYKGWYLTSDYLNERSVFTTFTILLLATIISGISGIIHNKYIFGIPNSWNECEAILESFIVGIFSLVVSSTFIIKSLTKEISLPGLPSIEFSSTMKTLHKDFKKLMKADAWKNFTSLNTEFISLVNSVDEEMNKILNLESDFLAKKSIKPVHDDVKNLRKVIDLINRKGCFETKKNVWKIFFEDEENLGKKEKFDRSKPPNKILFDSLQRLKRLELEDSICQKTILYISQLLHLTNIKLMK
jgi:hypothetical protein